MLNNLEWSSVTKKNSVLSILLCSTYSDKIETEICGISCSSCERYFKFLNRIYMLCIIYMGVLLNYLPFYRCPGCECI